MRSRNALYPEESDADYRARLIRYFGVSEDLGTCPYCVKRVESGDDWHQEEVETIHGDDEVIVGLAYVHDGCRRG